MESRGLPNSGTCEEGCSFGLNQIRALWCQFLMAFAGGQPAPGANSGDAEPALDPSESRQNSKSRVLGLFQMLRRERSELKAMTPELAAALRGQLDSLQAADLDISRALTSEIAEASGVGYLDIYQGSDFTLCAFVMRQGACIPLHDHPGMHVFGRLLFGRMKVVSFDLERALDEEDAPTAAGDAGQQSGVPSRSRSSPMTAVRPRHQFWSRLNSVEVLGPEPATYWLSPAQGNLHQLEAVEDCAFFDIVAPPYDALSGRDCTYYSPMSTDDVSVGQTCLLQKYKPRHFTTQVLRYTGPRWSSQ
eukprot:TRINITY_DN15903_c0_g1_i2.p1 TRINITY_DN15903_c0_g1~~TRINITY_DN15903_c0_g1_i2.p1  ORF type:complete len:304 (+),score=50.96 TRINITY_DN15903_c0_g1_i2:62-973(+)